MTTTMDLKPEHLNDAASLVASAFRRERQHVPSLPARYEDPASIFSMLERFLGKAPGIAALDGGRLVGFLQGVAIPEFKGTFRGVYCPEWAHAAAGPDRAGIYRLLYRQLAARWVADGCFTQALTLFAHDDEAVRAWFEANFGLLVMDACRPLAPLDEGPANAPSGALEIRQGGARDIPLVVPLGQGLCRHLAASPTFLAGFHLLGPKDWERWLAEPDHFFWLAFLDGRTVAYVKGERSTDSACEIVRDPGTFSLTGAYTLPELRSSGVATRLLSAIVEWAKANGYERCTVDFESANFDGRSFWLRHFTPVCYSLIRRVDERVAGGIPES